MGYHHGDLRTALVDAGIALVAEGGLPALSVAEAARLLGVSPSHIYRLMASDHTFPKLRKVGGASRIDPRELREWFDAQ